MPAALEQGRVIDDPVLNGAALLHRRHDPTEHPLPHGAVLPTGFADEMLDRLVPARDIPALQTLGDRLHALALTGQQQPSHVVAQPTPARIVAHNRAQILDILLEAPLHRGVEIRSFAHANEIRISQSSAIHQPQFCRIAVMTQSIMS